MELSEFLQLNIKNIIVEPIISTYPIKETQHTFLIPTEYANPEDPRERLYDEHFMLNDCPNVNEFGKGYLNEEAAKINFLFESDESSLRKQMLFSKAFNKYIFSSVFTGGHSIHNFISILDEEAPETCEQYKFIANILDQWLSSKGANVKFDRACFNNARRCRWPGCHYRKNGDIHKVAVSLNKECNININNRIHIEWKPLWEKFNNQEIKKRKARTKQISLLKLAPDFGLDEIGFGNWTLDKINNYMSKRFGDTFDDEASNHGTRDNMVNQIRCSLIGLETSAGLDSTLAQSWLNERIGLWGVKTADIKRLTRGV